MPHEDLFSSDHIHDFLLPEEVQLKCQTCGNKFKLTDIMEHVLSTEGPSGVTKES
jgi:hypothetical protein